MTFSEARHRRFSPGAPVSSPPSSVNRPLTSSSATCCSLWIMRIRRRQRPWKHISLLSVFLLVYELLRRRAELKGCRILNFVVSCRAGDFQMLCCVLKACAAGPPLLKSL